MGANKITCGYAITSPRCCSHILSFMVGVTCRPVSAFPKVFRGKLLLSCMDRHYSSVHGLGYNKKQLTMIGCSGDSSFGDTGHESTVIFPRINIKDPYKRLGISREASEEEIQAARGFLIHMYSGHKPSVTAIESAHDKIIMQKFHERKTPKINLKKKIHEASQFRAVQAVISRFEAPTKSSIIKTSITFLVLGALSVLFPTEEGPTLQVAISLMVTIYFIYDRLKSKILAFLYGAGAFLFAWMLGTFLMVSVIPPLLKGPRSLEVMTSLISYVLLWVPSNCLK